MRPPTTDELILLLASDNPNLIKRGLQWVCDSIEAGRRVDLNRDLRVARLISRLKRSENVFVRRWLYKLIGLLRVRAWSAWLGGQLAGGEPDRENLTWAFSALSAIDGPLTGIRRAEEGALDPASPALRLAADYFRSAPPVDPMLVSAALDTNDALTHQWISLRRGADVHAVPREVIRDIASTDHPTAVEYAIWAVHRDRFGRLADLSLNPPDLAAFPPNVRRWYVRLIVKHAENFGPYSDLVTDTMTDREPAVREGLALGLVDVPLDPLLARDVMSWFVEEHEPLVSLALRRVLVRHQRRYPTMSGLLNPPGIPGRPATIFVPARHKLRSHPTLEPLPAIDRDVSEQVYVLGIDTVDFSSRTDRQQYTIFRDLLDALRNEDLIVRQDPSEVAALPRGDGVFVCFRQPGNRLAPLRVALRLRRHFRDLRGYELRFGVNAGPATWILMRGGSTEVISHAVNWAARVMNAAVGNQVLVSDSYYTTIAKPSEDDLPEATFRYVEGLTTKHDERLPVWEAITR